MVRTAPLLIVIVAIGCAGTRHGPDDPHAACRAGLERERAAREKALEDLRTEQRLAQDRSEALEREVARLERELQAARATSAEHQQGFADAVDLLRRRDEELVALRRELADARESAVPVPPEGEMAGAMKLLKDQQEQIATLRDRLARAESGEAPPEGAAPSTAAGGVRLASLDLDRPVAVVDGEPISRREFVAFLYRDLATPALLDLYINRFIILREAARVGIVANEVDEQVWVEQEILSAMRSAGSASSFDRFLAERGYTREAWEARLRFQARPALALTRLIEAERRTPAGQERFQDRVRELYDKEYSERVSARHIFFRVSEKPRPEELAAARQGAQAAWQELERGVPFEEVARRFSQDGRTRELGGYLGELDRTRFAELPRLNTVLFTLQEGRVSRPVRSKLGFHIVRVDERQPPARPFDEATRKELAARLEEEPPSDAEKAALVERLRAQAHIRMTLSFETDR